MHYSHIIKREDKSSVKIEVRFNHDRCRDKRGTYLVEVYHKAPRKRTWVGFDTNDYTWRCIPFGSDDRQDYEDDWKLEYVTLEEISEAKKLCWLSFEPQ